jgi:hypothetical protein
MGITLAFPGGAPFVRTPSATGMPPLHYLKTSSNQSNMIWCSRLSLLTPQ